jgi:hypothetical protein
MYCPQCGGANDDTAAFCTSCGLDLNRYRQQWQESGAQATEQAQPAYHAPPYQTPPYQTTQYRQTAPYGSVPRVPSYLGWAIAVLICCFWPTGIAAVVFASQVDNKLVLGDVAGAKESSRKAKMWCWITFGIGVGLAVLGIIIAVIAVAVWGGARTQIY